MFRFAIRDLMWATLLIGFIVHAWIDRSQGTAREITVRRQLTESLVERDALQVQLQAANKETARFAGIARQLHLEQKAAAGEITSERAVEVVKSLVLREGVQAQFDCHEGADGFSIFVQFYVLDADGNKRFYPGGHAIYRLSKSGEVRQVIPGA